MNRKRCTDCKHTRGIGFDFWCGEGHTEYEVFGAETNCPYFEYHDWSKGVPNRTAKRFQYNVNKNSIECDNKHFAYCNGEQNKIAEKLNELNDECEFLEIDNGALEEGATKYAELYHKSLKENEQLKKEAEVYNEDAMSYQTLYEQHLEKFEELLSECKHQQEQKMKFYKENKELKQIIHRLKQNIDELLSVNVEEELLKENEQLQTKNNAYIQDIEVFKEENTHLKLENEQLKQSYKEFEDECQSTFNAMNRKQNDLYRKNFKLKEENEQLKSRVDYLERKIQRERNSTHKQYAKWEKEAEDKIKELEKENEKLKVQLLYDGDGVCNICKHQYLVENGKYYVAKCEKEHEECSKVDLQYCEDFELVRDYE